MDGKIVVILCYAVVINLIALVLFGVDKRRAQWNGELEKQKRKRKPDPALTSRMPKRRIPEKTLFAVSAIGGSVGAIAGMWLFRHKTQHWYFVYGMPGILLAQLAIIWVAVRGIN